MSCSTEMAARVQIPSKALHRWLLALLMIIVVGAGWKYPALGFIVPAAMMAGVVGGFSRGRYVCGNICPRGSFYDTFFRFVEGGRPIPELLRKPAFRWGILSLLMGFMAYRISLNPGDPMHWGSVFWFMCAATTTLGIALGLVYRARTWCSFCPVGTMAAGIGGEKFRLEIDSSCKSCGTCEKNCPMELGIREHKGGYLPHRDCIKCSSCMQSCRHSALSWPSSGHS